MKCHFFEQLRSVFANRTNSPAITYRGGTYSFGELEALAQSCAVWLISLGVFPGDRVALCTSDKIAFVAAHLGTLYAGGVSLPLNPKFTREELRFFLTDSGARVVVAGADDCSRLESLRSGLPELRAIVADSEILNNSGVRYHEVPVAADDPCLILYSSGTTGWPKGVVHTHAKVANALSSLASSWRMSPDDTVVNVLPLFHIHGLSIATQLTLLSGGHVLVEDAFHPVETLKAIDKATVFMAVPTIYYKFLEQPVFRVAAKSWSKTRLFTCGSAPIRPDVLPELESILGKPVINRYGMSEAFVITSLPLSGPWPQGSVGKPIDGAEVRLTDVKDHVGAVSIRGPNLFREYWGNPAATRAAFLDGWFDTGDLGTLNDAGFLTLVGRKHDLIITNGYNVYPQVVERVLNDCAGVRESAVVGIPDRHRGERVVVFVVKDDESVDEQRLLAHCAERLVDYQRPTEVVFVAELPRNTMGKVMRRELQETMSRETLKPS